MTFCLLEQHVLIFNTFTEGQTVCQRRGYTGTSPRRPGHLPPFNPTAAGALATAIAPTSTFPAREAPRSLEELPRPGRAGKQTPGVILPLSCVSSLRASRSNSSLLIFCLNHSFRLAQYLGKSREPQNQFGWKRPPRSPSPTYKHHRVNLTEGLFPRAPPVTRRHRRKSGVPTPGSGGEPLHGLGRNAGGQRGRDGSRDGSRDGGREGAEMGTGMGPGGSRSAQPRLSRVQPRASRVQPRTPRSLRALTASRSRPAPR